MLTSTSTLSADAAYLIRLCRWAKVAAATVSSLFNEYGEIRDAETPLNCGRVTTAPGYSARRTLERTPVHCQRGTCSRKDDHVVCGTQDYIKQMADKYFVPQAIVIGHLNHLPVTHVYDALLDIIRARGLQSVTLNDVFLV